MSCSSAGNYQAKKTCLFAQHPSFHQDYEEEEAQYWGHVKELPQPRAGYAQCLECIKPQPHFGDEVGFGQHVITPGYVVAAVGITPPLLVASLDQSVHKNYYHSVEGKVLAYLLHPRLLRRVQPDATVHGMEAEQPEKEKSRGQVPRVLCFRALRAGGRGCHQA